MSTQPKAIYTAIGKVMDDLKPIKKEKDNAFHHYKYRGVDDVYNALQPLFAKHGIFNTVEIISKEDNVAKNDKGKAEHSVNLHVRYHFISTLDESEITVDGISDATDTSDKASSKALAQAHKYALLQLFMVPTDDFKDCDSGDTGGQMAEKPAQRTAQKSNQQPAQQPAKPVSGGNTQADPKTSGDLKASFITRLQEAKTKEEWSKLGSQLKGSQKHLVPDDYAEIYTTAQNVARAKIKEGTWQA